MSIRFDASGESLFRSLSGLSETSFTLAGWGQMMSNRGATTPQPIVGVSANTSVSADIFYSWNDDGAVARIGSYHPSGTPEESAADFASRPAVNDQFFWYVRAGGLGVQAGWRRQADSAWVTAECDYVSGAAFGSCSVYLGRGVFNLWSNRRQGAFYIFDSALTDSELLSQMNQLAPIKSAWAYYPFNQATAANNYTDQSGNGRNLSTAGTMTVEANIPTAYPALGSNVQYWNGTAWVAKPLKRWNGSAWVPATLKRWSGSAWVTE